MNNIDFVYLKKYFSSKKKIVITTHRTPDGDALGSSLALFHSLENSHNVSVIVPNEYPQYLKSELVQSQNSSKLVFRKIC